MFTGVVLIVCSATLSLVYHLTIGEQRRELHQRVHLASQGFVDLTKAESITAEDLLNAIEERLEDDRTLFLVLGHAGGVTGKIRHFPASFATFPRSNYVTVEHISSRGKRRSEVVVGSQVDTPFGPLIVGFYEGKQAQLEQRYFRASALVLIATVLISLVAGFIYNRRVLARVTAMTQQLQNIQSGELKQRLALTPHEDEFDLLSEHINQMLDEIDGLVESIRGVTDNIAHDLRTPLSRMRISIESQLQQQTDEESWLLPLLEEIDHIIATFDAMLELARLEKGSLDDQRQPCDLDKICRDAIELMEPIAEDKLQLHYLAPENGNHAVKTVMGSPHLLFRAVYNLLDNAVRYTPAGGKVTLQLTGNSIIVSDNGPGIPAEHHEQVFQRLTRLDASRHSKGFGLGLAIVQAIVKLHHGQIDLADNQPGLKVEITF